VLEHPQPHTLFLEQRQELAGGLARLAAREADRTQDEASVEVELGDSEFPVSTLEGSWQVEDIGQHAPLDQGEEELEGVRLRLSRLGDEGIDDETRVVDRCWRVDRPAVDRRRQDRRPSGREVA
jgi:hypothetical protein